MYGTVFPNKLMAYKGTVTIIVQCFSTSKVVWYTPNIKIIPKTSTFGNSLIFEYARRKDTGNYTCVGSTPTDVFSANFELFVGS